MFNNGNIYILEGNMYGHAVVNNTTTKKDFNNYYYNVNNFLKIHL